MEDVQKNVSQNGFINHVFKFDDDTKAELMNIVQYVAIALIPTALLHYLVKSLVPKLEESKGNIELLIEVMGEFFIILFGFFFIHRIIEYIPTYSGKALGSMNIFSIMLLFMISRHEEEDSKVKILLNRAGELWNGKESVQQQQDNSKKEKNPIINVSKNIPRTMPTHQTSRADYVNSHNQMMPEPPSQMQTGGSGASNNMYQGTPDSQPFSEPLAANEGFGGFTQF